MPDPHDSAERWHHLADALARADDLQQALDIIASDSASLLQTRACIVQPTKGGWKIRAQARGGLDLSTSELPAALTALSTEQSISGLDLRSMGQGFWTSLSLTLRGNDPIVLLLAGDVTALFPRVKNLAVWLPIALDAVSDRVHRGFSQRVVRDVHLMARRLGRLGSVETTARRIVEHTARTIPAERITLAVHRPEEHRLVIVAAHGYDPAEVQHVRIEPGAWVIGHVYASGRALLVRDVRQICGAPATQRGYRTFSFAAAPICAGGAVLGVLTATDKIDGSPFNNRDNVALRLLSGVAALGLSAAHFGSEAERLARAVNVDSLTGLFNRPWFETRLHQEIERAKRCATTLVLLMADVDDFKLINDTHGHPVGDSVLQAVGEVLRSAIRVFDVCARYGGDEFAILMPNSDEASAIASAERIRRRIAESCARGGSGASTSPLTVSIGVTVLQPGDSAAELIRRADESLYRAKAAGKNTVNVLPDRPAVRQLQEAPVVWPSNCDD